VGAVSFDAGVVSVEDSGDVSVAVELLSVVPASNCMPKAPEAIIPAQSSAPNPRTIPARRSAF
jgi:hypothetical protein